MKLKVKKPSGATVTWNINARCRKKLEPVVAEFGLSVEHFLKRFSLGRLPRQLSRPISASRIKLPRGTKVKFECSDKDVAARIERAAAFDGIGVEEFLYHTILDTIGCIEEEMIISPTTGQPIPGVTRGDLSYEFCRHDVCERRAA